MSSKNDYEYGARSCRMDQVRRLSLFSYKSIISPRSPVIKASAESKVEIAVGEDLPSQKGVSGV